MAWNGSTGVVKGSDEDVGVVSEAIGFAKGSDLNGLPYVWKRAQFWHRASDTALKALQLKMTKICFLIPGQYMQN